MRIRRVESSEPARKPGSFFGKHESEPAQAAFFQTKLAFGQVGDPYEQEADRVADTVTNRTSDRAESVQRAGAEKEEEKPVQSQADKEEEKPVQSNAEKKEEEKPVQSQADKEEEKPVQAKAEPAGFAVRLRQARGKGSRLPAAVRVRMERAFGRDFSGVRIHTDTESAALSRSIGAQAFTSGRDIFFNQGRFSPDTDQGRHLLAHELTHVVQQSK